jgi:hypothetical protein
METEEIYDVLMAQLVATIRKYDPYYAEKVKLVVERIDDELSKRAQFSITDVNRYLDFECDRHLRLLGRAGFLAPFSGQDRRIAGCSRTEQWPPPDFLKSGAIGVAYSIQQWFRFQPIQPGGEAIWLGARGPDPHMALPPGSSQYSAALIAHMQIGACSHL